MKVLLIEDEVKAIEALKQGFQEHQIIVDVAYDGQAGLQMAEMNLYDVIISDIIVPYVNGFELVKQLRSKHNLTPIILLTALTGADNTVEGLEAGADDYMVKPFEFKELLARLKALARRGKDRPQAHQILQFADIRMDIDAKELYRAKKKIDLTPKEFALLEYFIRHQGRVISKAEIAEKVWDINFDTNTNMIEVYINYLRNKIDRPFEKKLIHTIFGSGYIFKMD
ncbi:MAG: response regulator transcription factor [Saprospiraceae bacterium]|nr:response regulator transcription factor [Saprospiraceae bacterium]